MANQSYLNPWDEDDETKPYDSISSRSPLEDVGAPAPGMMPDMNLPPSPGEPSNAPNPAVMDFIRSQRAMTAPALSTKDILNDPYMKLYQEDQAKVQSGREAKIGADALSNMGASFAQLAQGVNTPKENPVYQTMTDQNKGMLSSLEGDADRRRKVIDAIENRKTREGDRALQRALLQGKMDETKQNKELQLAVPGFERTGEVLPKVEEAVKLRNAVASTEQLSSKLNELKDLVKDVGSFEYGGEKGQRMKGLATEIQLLSKNPEMYNLGVLTGPDLDLLTSITADPDSIKSLFTRNSTRLAQIDSQIKSVGNKLQSSAKSLGYRPKGASGPMGASNETSKSGKVLVTDGKQTLSIDPSDLADAEKDGFRRM